MSVSEPPPATTFRFPGPDHRALLLGLRAPQVAILGITVAAAVGLLMAVPTSAGLGLTLAVFAVGVPTAVVRVRRRSIDEWAPVVARWWWRRARGQLRWVSPVPLLGERADHGERASPPPPLAGVSLLKVSRVGSRDVAVAKDARAGTFTGVVACGGRAFALLDGAEQDRLCALWGQALAAFAQEGSPVTRVAWVERTVPEDGDALHAYLGDNAVLEPYHPLRASYEGLIANAGPLGQHHGAYVVVSIGASKGRRAIRQAGGGDEGACEVLLRELTTLVDRLRQAEVDVTGVLGPRQLAGCLRTAFDPASARPLARRARQEPSRGGTTGRNAWPLATEVTWSHYRTDSGVHATYWVAELPRRDVYAGFLQPLLLRPSGMHAVAVVMEPVAPSKAARAVESAHASHVADEELRARAGYLPSARRRREHEDILAREAELAAGHGEYRFSAYVSVTAPDPEALEFLGGEIEQLGFDAQVELRRLYGEQDAAFTYTLPLGRGLR